MRRAPVADSRLLLEPALEVIQRRAELLGMTLTAEALKIVLHAAKLEAREAALRVRSDR